MRTAGENGLGVPPEGKRHVLFDSGHAPPLTRSFKEALDWLDRCLGPVKYNRAGLRLLKADR